jgi:hypothetical protein
VSTLSVSGLLNIINSAFSTLANEGYGRNGQKALDKTINAIKETVLFQEKPSVAALINTAKLLQLSPELVTTLTQIGQVYSQQAEPLLVLMGKGLPNIQAVTNVLATFNTETVTAVLALEKDPKRKYELAKIFLQGGLRELDGLGKEVLPTGSAPVVGLLQTAKEYLQKITPQKQLPEPPYFDRTLTTLETCITLIDQQVAYLNRQGKSMKDLLGTKDCTHNQIIPTCQLYHTT